MNIIQKQPRQANTVQIKSPIKISTVLKTWALVVLVMSLSACSSLPFLGQKDLIATSNSCGTTSQDSEVHYFDDAQEFGQWIDYRRARGLKAEWADRYSGVIVVEMGQRMTSGYKMKYLADKTKVEDQTLKLVIHTTAPADYAPINQAMTSPCMVLKPIQGAYDKIEVFDQLGNRRAKTTLD